MSSKKRGKNSSFYHFRLQELDPLDKNKYLSPQYFTTAFEVCETYNISRASLYRILKNPNVKTSIPFRIEKCYIHKTALDLINN